LVAHPCRLALVRGTPATRNSLVASSTGTVSRTNFALGFGNCEQTPLHLPGGREGREPEPVRFLLTKAPSCCKQARSLKARQVVKQSPH
jgi:hypothetical protein